MSLNPQKSVLPRAIALKVMVFLNDSVLVNEKQSLKVSERNRELQNELIVELRSTLADLIERPVSIEVAKNPVMGKGFLVVLDELANVTPELAATIMSTTGGIVRHSYTLGSDMHVTVKFGPLQKDY